MPSIASCLTNHLRILFSRSSVLLPLPRVTAPVSRTTAARPVGLSEARGSCSQAQSALLVVRLVGLRRARESVAACRTRERGVVSSTGRAAGVSVNFSALLGVCQTGDAPADLSQRAKFAGSLALAFGEFAQELLVGAARKVR